MGFGRFLFELLEDVASSSLSNQKNAAKKYAQNASTPEQKEKARQAIAELEAKQNQFKNTQYNRDLLKNDLFGEE